MGQSVAARTGQGVERCSQNNLGKLVHGKLHIWEVATWENTVGREVAAWTNCFRQMPNIVLVNTAIQNISGFTESKTQLNQEPDLENLSRVSNLRCSCVVQLSLNRSTMSCYPLNLVQEYFLNLIIFAVQLVPDPYESMRTEVRRSSILGAGEGLFATRDILQGDIVRQILNTWRYSQVDLLYKDIQSGKSSTLGDIVRWTLYTRRYSQVKPLHKEIQSGRSSLQGDIVRQILYTRRYSQVDPLYKEIQSGRSFYKEIQSSRSSIQ